LPISVGVGAALKPAHFQILDKPSKYVIHNTLGGGILLLPNRKQQGLFSEQSEFYRFVVHLTSSQTSWTDPLLRKQYKSDLSKKMTFLKTLFDHRHAECAR
jgi:hypothetical protein